MPLQTPSQTVGPFFHFSLHNQNTLTNGQTRGEHIRLLGTVFDGDGEEVPDAIIEIWQADSNGRFNHPHDIEHEQADKNFLGFGRSDTTQNGTYWFDTIMPGTRDSQTPHINVRVFSRGLLIHLVTRIYFSDDANDAVLNSLDSSRRQTLIATTDDATTYRFDIHLQGELETVFFDV